jgi:type I phosphodiesterase/nucleotide pyrophosphatase
VKRLAALLLLILSAVVAAAPSPQPSGTELRLVLLIAVDQFRYDYLTRFRSDYQQGLKKLLTEGAVFTDANLEHYPTVTAIGHSTMLSGATPSVSGIVGNDWYDRATGVTVTSVSDGSVEPTGAFPVLPPPVPPEKPAAPPEPGSAAAAALLGASPRRLLVSTVGDELKMASRARRGENEAPRVIGLSLKDRAAILPAGRGADAAYWWDTKGGSFISSTYYGPQVAPWVAEFNGRHGADTFAGRSWSMLTAPAAKAFKALPPERGPALYQAIYDTPYGSELLLDFATQAIERERLGQRGVTDLLTVSFSSNDSIGHTFGPDSPQVRDMATRTDRLIGALLDRIDKRVGLQHTVVALTADHGVAPLPEMLKERSLPGGRITTKELFDPIQAALERKYGAGKWLLSTAGSSPYLNYELAAQHKVELVDLRRTAAQTVAALPHVARVYTRDDLLRGDVPDDRIGRRLIRGFNAQRSGDLEVVLEPYWLRQATGTTHGTPYNYDAHIPLILMGSRIKAGEYSNAVALNDLAPTLATIAGVEIPSGSVGRVLTEALRPESR